MKQILLVLLVLIIAGIARPVFADYDPGFGDYDPNRKCYQAWCYTGGQSNDVGSIQTPKYPKDYMGIGLGTFIKDDRIQFMEMAFHDQGSYQARLEVATNVGSKNLQVTTVLKGKAKLRDSALVMTSKPSVARSLMRGRFLKVSIFRDGKLYAAAVYPLYGFTKAYTHMR